MTMALESSDFQSRVATFLGLDGAVLTDGELSRLAERYPRCGGKEPWEVREYARPGRPGARDYRVVRGSRVDEVYRSLDRASALAVRAALNELESREAFAG